MAKYFICAIRNRDAGGGMVAQAFYTDPAEAARFAAQWDKPECRVGVYDCIGRLNDNAGSRSRDQVAEIHQIVSDLDLRHIEQSRDEVIRCLQSLPLPPTEIRDSGFGIHAYWALKEAATDRPGIEQCEAIMKRLATLLAADPAPTHAAALLRRVGTHNSKEGAWNECRLIERSGTECDICEFEDMFELYGDRPLLTRKPADTTHANGGNGATPPFRDGDGRLDIEAAMAAMEPNGPSVNDIQPRVVLSLLQKAGHPDDIVKWVAEETVKKANAAGVPWTREVELKCVLDRCKSSVAKLNGEYDPTGGTIPVWLAGEFHPAWLAGLTAGKRPGLYHSSHIGWHVRCFGGRDKEDTQEQPAGEQEQTAKAATPPPGQRAQKQLVLRPFVRFDPATLPPRAWLYAKHYQRRTVSLTAGPGGMGKSSLVLVECIAMATARNLLGEQPTERLRIWLHNGEDPLDEILRRVAAICAHYDIPQEELEGQLWITSGNEFPLRVAKGYTNLEINAALVSQISDAIAKNQIDLAAFDPLVTLHSVSEGDPGKMDAVVRLFAGIADDHDASVELNHHVRKPPAGAEIDLDVHDIRGVMAITDAVRAARVLNRMSRADAENAGVDEVARQSYFRVDRAKGNYSPAQAATWRQFVSVDLPNGDDVGVVTPWAFPGQGMSTPQKAAADQKAERVFLLLLDKYEARGLNVNASGGANYAPAKFATEKEAKAEKISKAALKAAMGRLLDTGRVKSETTTRGHSRLMRGFALEQEVA
jgi:RecA-family ATPase